MAQAHAEDDEITGINVTPLVDVTLVLLIIFMVTAKLVMAQALPLDLPKAATAGETQTVLSIRIDADGAVRANDAPVDGDGALTEIVRAAQAATPELRAVLAASEHVSHGKVMHVLDLLRGAGVAKVAFAAEKER